MIAVAGTVHLILAVCLLALAYRPRLTLPVVYHAVGVVIAAAINLPFVPTFVATQDLPVPFGPPQVGTRTPVQQIEDHPIGINARRRCADSPSRSA